MEEPLYDAAADTRAEDAALDAVRGAPLPRKLWAYTKLSGPGWLQGAITLGGGSLAGALYLGVIGGYDTLWVQPLAMVLGVVMLAAVGYVALSTGQRPLVSVNTRISPVLGWAWLLAVLVANHVWCLPQYSLAEAAVQQNLLPSLRYNGTGLDWAWVVGLVTFLFTATIVVFYDAGSKGVKVVEAVLKAMVGLIVLAFIAVVVVLAIRGALPFGKIFAGLIPTLSSATQPTADLQTLIDRTGPAAAFWTNRVAAQQRDIVIGAFGVAVGINMTFLLPYSLLKKGWRKRHRGLAIYDLSIGLVVPFFLATTCLVIASASQFHAQSNDVLDAAGKPKPAAAASYYGALEARLNATAKMSDGSSIGAMNAADLGLRYQDAVLDRLPAADHAVAAALVSRDADNLATTLEPLVGKTVAQYVFGLGVLGMAVSTIIVLMLMNSFAVSEALGMPNSRTVRLIGAMMPGVLGLFAPAIWSRPNQGGPGDPRQRHRRVAHPHRLLHVLPDDEQQKAARPRPADGNRPRRHESPDAAVNDRRHGRLRLGVAGARDVGLRGHRVAGGAVRVGLDRVPVPRAASGNHRGGAVNFGVVGAGNIGRFHARAIRDMRNGTLRGVACRGGEKAAKARRRVRRDRLRKRRRLARRPARCRSSPSPRPAARIWRSSNKPPPRASTFWSKSRWR